MNSVLPLVVLGSARPAGHTAALVGEVLGLTGCQVADLLTAPLHPYSYAGHYPPDDAFADLVPLLLRHDTLVLATPVYWYAMSGLLKTFLDRLTDLVTIAKPLGRQLAGRRLLVLASGSDPALPPGFLEPFRLAAAYFGMSFAGSLYYSQKAPPAPAAWQQQVAAFRAALEAPASLLP